MTPRMRVIIAANVLPITFMMKPMARKRARQSNRLAPMPANTMA